MSPDVREQYDLYHKIFMDVYTSVYPGCSDIRDGWEVCIGRDVIWGTELSGQERIDAVRAAMLPAISGRAIRFADDYTDYVRLKDKLRGEEIFEEAVRGRGSPLVGAGTSCTLQDAQRLADTYGGDPGDWAKMGGACRTLSDGRKSEIHWDENLQTGVRVEFKTKLQ